jgi:splicing factor 1
VFGQKVFYSEGFNGVEHNGTVWYSSIDKALDALQCVITISTWATSNAGLSRAVSVALSSPRHNPACASLREIVKKIRLPLKEHPDFNFFGLLIGKGGDIKHQLDAKTKCNIELRGIGNKKRKCGTVKEGDDEPLHVVITGDDQRLIDAASEMIEQLLADIRQDKSSR